ncbi:DUF3347 domain-containing protein [Flavobacterium sp. SM15]|uniref:DUF3347 domain-containing protein n=1 Tax=Flavobacterium sp. SM15 TaxID=2908005 RepID=UPI001EDA6AF1|nr:DUF3347 domain-containing protein [Flavobacterium sp. SM15]MCG2611613.1 DUF3347 domain-containing protein [Flavobacterium sp. SM15]
MKKLFVLLMSCLGFMTTQAQSNDWNHMLKSYLDIEDALVASNLNDAKSAMSQMQKEALQILPKATGNAAQKELKFIAARLEVYGKSESIEDVRAGFDKLSNSMIVLAEQKVFGSETLYVVYCPMKKANWLDDANTVKNPYYGKAMLTCGSVKKTIN